MEVVEIQEEKEAEEEKQKGGKTKRTSDGDYYKQLKSKFEKRHKATNFPVHLLRDSCVRRSLRMIGKSMRWTRFATML